MSKLFIDKKFRQCFFEGLKFVELEKSEEGSLTD